MSAIEKNDAAIDLARYKQAAKEIENGSKDEALWYKAFTERGGDENATKAAYIRLRVEQLRKAAGAASTVRVTATQSNPAVKQSLPSATTPRNNQTPANSLYSVLGVAADATDVQIIEGHRKKKDELDARENKDTETRNRLIFIQHAKEVLLDPAKRAQYDDSITIEAAQRDKAQPGAAKTMTNSADEPAPLEQHDLYRAYLGEKNADYYLDKFDAFDREGDGLHASWNWAAFLANGFWFLYRKMYGWFFVCWGIATLENLADKGGAGDWVIIFILPHLFLTVFANSIYHNRAKKKIATATTRLDLSRNQDALLASLQRQGGVHPRVLWVLWVFLAIVVFVAIAGVVTAIFDTGDAGTQPAAERPTMEQPASRSLAESTEADWVKLVCLGTGEPVVLQFNESLRLVRYLGTEIVPSTMSADRIDFRVESPAAAPGEITFLTVGFLDRVSGRLSMIVGGTFPDGRNMSAVNNYSCKIAQNKF